MTRHAKLGIVIVALFILYVIYILTSNEGIGSFEKIRAAGEINQSITVYVDQAQGFERDQNGNIASFYVTDKNGEQARVSPHEPVTAEIANAATVELFGHMHGNNFVATRVSIVEKATE